MVILPIYGLKKTFLAHIGNVFVSCTLLLCFPARQMICEGYLEDHPVQGSFGSTVDLSRKGEEWFNKASRSPEVKLELLPNHELQAFEKEKVKVEVTYMSK